MKDYLIGGKESEKDHNKNLVLIIYDVADNKRRTKLFKFLSGYLKSVQRSCFENYLTEAQLNKIKSRINYYIDKKEDNVRIYELSAYGKVYNYGQNIDNKIEEILIL